MNKQTALLEKSKSHAIIQKSPYKCKHRYNQRSQQDNLEESQIRQNQTQKTPQVYIYIYIYIYRELEQKFK